MTKQGLFKLLLLFSSLFLINILVLLVLQTLEFDIELGTVSYLFPPIVTTIVLTMIDKNLRKNKE